MWLIFIPFIIGFVDKVSSLVYCSFPKYSYYYSAYYGSYQQSLSYYTATCDDYCQYSTCGYYYKPSYSTTTVVKTTYTGAIVGGVVGFLVIMGVLIGVAIYCGVKRPGRPGQVLNPGIMGHSTVPYVQTPDMRYPAEPLHVTGVNPAENVEQPATTTTDN
ncbi:uncharacterized protein LOC133194508 isoform X2 [Saccostrea echinata]|uniref:uncharacterized protein LOC133194508 isoform X2 n=1 Tax=Saccostrea echinata TaxID=191078 RepID=UPI002A840CF0|nr:uncharacterized protein LOC133194508 isoform X2 [Saccostrea echinata]